MDNALKKLELCRAGLMKVVSSLTSLSSFGVNFRSTGDCGDAFWICFKLALVKAVGLDGALVLTDFTADGENPDTVVVPPLPLPARVSNRYRAADKK